MMTLWPALLIPIAAASPLIPHPTTATAHTGRVMTRLQDGSWGEQERGEECLDWGAEGPVSTKIYYRTLSGNLCRER